MSTFVNTLQGFLITTKNLIKSKLFPTKLKVHSQPTDSTSYVEDMPSEYVVEPAVEPVIEPALEPVIEPAVEPIDNSLVDEHSSERVTHTETNV